MILQLKTLERLCGWHMDEVLKLKPLHTQQHGFRTDRNTETAISRAANYIEKHIYNGEHVILLLVESLFLLLLLALFR